MRAPAPSMCKMHGYVGPPDIPCRECEIQSLRSQLKEVQEDYASESAAWFRMSQQRDQARSQLEEARAAMRLALDELGVPGDGYPAPIANAVEILRGALSPQQEGER